MSGVPSIIQSRVAFNAIRMYAALSYLYYERGESVASDADFDELCSFLLANYEWVKPHDLNNYLSKASLKAGTGYDISGKVCGQTKAFAESLLPAKSKKAEPVRKKEKVKRNIEDLLG
jgi:hypothetical protein